MALAITSSRTIGCPRVDSGDLGGGRVFTDLDDLQTALASWELAILLGSDLSGITVDFEGHAEHDLILTATVDVDLVVWSQRCR